MELQRVVDAHNGGSEAQNGAPEGLRPVVSDFHNFEKSSIRIRIRIKVMRIRNPGSSVQQSYTRSV